MRRLRKVRKGYGTGSYILRSVRLVDYDRDIADLRDFVSAKGMLHVQSCQDAVANGDAYILVAERDERVIGVAVVHVAARKDMGWEQDGLTISFMEGTNAYLANIEVSPGMRGRGIGGALLRQVEEEARRRGKVRIWLHADGQNAGAHRFYERHGWRHERTVHPSWKQGRASRIYVKKL
jgi:ribosomal protein S18 acetylase RimI-like enzyme